MPDMTIRDVRVTLAHMPWPDEPMLSADHCNDGRALFARPEDMGNSNTYPEHV